MREGGAGDMAVRKGFSEEFDWWGENYTKIWRKQILGFSKAGFKTRRLGEKADVSEQGAESSFKRSVWREKQENKIIQNLRDSK